jgi:hypothetical protein
LGRWDGHPFDVTVLDVGRPLFALPVLRTGPLGYVGDVEAHTDFIEAVSRAYREVAPRYFRAVREVLAEGLASGGR